MALTHWMPFAGVCGEQNLILLQKALAGKEHSLVRDMLMHDIMSREDMLQGDVCKFCSTSGHPLS